MKGLTADGLEFEVLPIGTRIRHSVLQNQLRE